MKNTSEGLVTSNLIKNIKAKHSSFLIRNKDSNLSEPKLNNFLEEPLATNDITDHINGPSFNSDSKLKFLAQNEIKPKPFTRIPIKNSTLMPLTHFHNIKLLEKQREVEEDLFKYLAKSKKKKKRPRPPTILIASLESSAFLEGNLESSKALTHFYFRENPAFMDKDKPIIAEILNIFKVEDFPEVDTYPKDEIILHKKLMRKDRIKDPFYLELEERITLNTVIFRTG